MKRIHIPRDRGTDALPPLLSDIEIARMWKALNATPPPVPRRRPSRPPLVLGLLLGAVAAGAAFGIVLWLSPGAAPGIEAEALAETTTTDREIELPDGSRVILAPDAKLRIGQSSPEDVQVSLARGAADVAVAPAPGQTRRFVITAGGFDVRASGARLRVAVHGELADRRVEVSVQTGDALIHRHGAIAGEAPIPLGAGQSWSSESTTAR